MWKMWEFILEGTDFVHYGKHFLNWIFLTSGGFPFPAPTFFFFFSIKPKETYSEVRNNKL